MTSVCLYFQVHQPYRLRRYSFFDVGRHSEYFDTALNAEIIRRVASRCYVPANKALLRAIRALDGRFSLAFSITGVAIEQMRAHAPEALESFRELAKTGCVEFLNETYYHSLASLFDSKEFVAQVDRHRELIEEEFGLSPRAFRNTELIYSDSIGNLISSRGYRAILAEGLDRIVGSRSVGGSYRVPGGATRLLLRDYKLSDDVAYRFNSSGADGGPLTAEVFARKISERASNGGFVGLFMDYETFGEHLPHSSGVLEFLEKMPEAVLALGTTRFVRPGEIDTDPNNAQELSVPEECSWADTARDVSAWKGNSMQQSALRAVYDLAPRDPASVALWRNLQTSDHYYYMATKVAGDGDVHSYFSSFESPYDAFIAMMNVVRDFKGRIESTRVDQRSR